MKILNIIGCASLLMLPAIAFGQGGQMGKQSESEMGQASSQHMQERQETSAETVQLTKSQIESMQRALTEIEPNLAVDGIWGPNTKQALTKYQRQNDLQVTGRPDQETLASLGVQTETR